MRCAAASHLGDEVGLRLGLLPLRSRHGHHPHLEALLHDVDAGQFPVHFHTGREGGAACVRGWIGGGATCAAVAAPLPT